MNMVPTVSAEPCLWNFLWLDSYASLSCRIRFGALTVLLMCFVAVGAGGGREVGLLLRLGLLSKSEVKSWVWKANKV